VLCHGNGEKVGAIDVNTPELANSVDRVIDGFKVLGEASRRDQIVYLAVLCEYLGNGFLDGFLGRYIGVVCSDFWDSVSD